MSGYLFAPVFQHQTRHPLKSPCVVGHQDGAGDDGMSGDRRVIRANRCAGQTRLYFDPGGGIDRGAASGPVAPKRISE